MVHTGQIQGVRESIGGGVMPASRLCERNSRLASSGKYTPAGLIIHSCVSSIRKQRNTGFYSIPATRAYFTVHLVKVHYQANRYTNLVDRDTCCEKTVFQNQPVNRSNSIIFILIILYYFIILCPDFYYFFTHFSDTYPVFFGRQE
jgi:hypothetical protein